MIKYSCFHIHIDVYVWLIYMIALSKLSSLSCHLVYHKRPCHGMSRLDMSRHELWNGCEMRKSDLPGLNPAHLSTVRTPSRRSSPWKPSTNWSLAALSSWLRTHRRTRAPGWWLPWQRPKVNWVRWVDGLEARKATDGPKDRWQKHDRWTSGEPWFIWSSQTSVTSLCQGKMTS